LRGLIAVTLSSALLMAVATLVGVYFVAGRLTHRLEQLAADVADGAPGRGYVRSGMEREIFVLASALESLEARQRALLEREREFSVHLGHELRTPLTGIRTDAELIAVQPDLPAPVLRRAGRIIGAVDRITDLAASLLALARETQPGLVEEVALADAVAAAWEPLAAEAGGKAVTLLVDVASTACVRCDQALLELVLRNLLDNALRHSASGVVSCRLEGRVLAVHDCGPGIAAADLPHVFERFFRAGSQAGHGLGLALVRHVCGAAGWTVHAANAAAGGAVFSVDFGDTLRV
jgi:signal transduction histidine kinase